MWRVQFSNGMNIEHLVGKLNTIVPRAEYTKRSRGLLVGSSFRIEKDAFRPWHLFLHGIQFGSALALVGLLFLLISGSFSAWQSASPFRLSSLDPAGLRAEAEAVDIQLQLTGIAYREPARQTTAPMANAEAQKQAEGLGIHDATSSISLDEALDELIK